MMSLDAASPNNSLHSAAPAVPAIFAASRGVRRTLIGVAVPHFLLLVAAASIAAWAMRPTHRDIAATAGPIPALVGAALLLSVTALASTLLLTMARTRSLDGMAEGQSGRVLPVVRSAGAPQALLLLAGGTLSAFAGWQGWVQPAFAIGPASPACTVMLLLASFPLLVAERAVASLPPARLVEAGPLAAVLRLPVATCLALAALQFVAPYQVQLAALGARVLAALLLISALEMVLRTFGIWFAPPPSPSEARARIGSIVALALRPGSLSIAAASKTMRTQFGIDFSRSWALAFVRRSFLPVLATLLCLSWLLSGVVRVGLDQRAVYERFGAPRGVLQPGLHLLLPWPLGRAGTTEFGIVHAIAVSDDALPVAGSVGPPAMAPAMAKDRSGAEDTAPAGANRLWDQSSPDISYLVAREQAGRQSFETVSVDLRVLYRIGLDPDAARASLYRTADPAGLVLVLSRRLLAHFFAGQTLAAVMDERREKIAEALRLDLQRQLDTLDSGIVVTGLVVDSLHPPIGAASAYRKVQAAEIEARAAVSVERGRAGGLISVSRRDAHDRLDKAAATAAEILGTATADDRRMQGDVRAWRAGGPAFLLERRLANTKSALSAATLEIIDSRLTSGMLDLRTSSSASQDTGNPDTNGGTSAP